MNPVRKTFYTLVIIFSLAFLVGFARQSDVETIGFNLRPPFDGQYPLTSYFDHHYPNYDEDNEITIYDGEQVSNCSPHCYHGHSGIDWGMGEGTSVYAAASGIVEYRITSPSSGYGNRLVIKHTNGYRTLYAHLRQPNPFNVNLGDTVSTGDLIGWSGNTGNTTGPHLHFGVYRGPFTLLEENVTDPFGWRGSYPDPLNSFYNGHTATCLWRNYDVDPVSCVDTMVEDGAALGYFEKGDTWQVAPYYFGHGSHMYYRSTTTVNESVSWRLPTERRGFYKFYAWIPHEYASSERASYGIWTANGWQTVTINQHLHNDEWVYLGTFKLNPSMYPSNNYVVLNANTGEPAGTKLVGADAIKIRSYPVFLPSIVRAVY